MIREGFLRWYLPFYFAIYLGVCFIWRSYLVWKRTGKNPMVLGSSDSVFDYVGRWFKFAIVLIAIVVGAFVISKEAYAWLVPITYLEQEALVLIGIGLTIISLVWIAVAQAQMGASWRIGIDHKNKTGLVSVGLFRRSRNPIFLGMIWTIMGFFLILPNAVSLLALVLGYVLIQIQVRLEEEFLERAHGSAYLEYRRMVRRWL